MSEDEKIIFRDALNRMTLLGEQIKEHSKDLKEGTKKMTELELSLAKLKCGEHELTMSGLQRDVDRHITAGDKWRLAIVCSALSLFVSVISGIGAFYTMQEKVSHIERTIYAEHKNN
ncbi:MAG: hypothetical protein GYA69_04785 [Candidatus Moranbacteria bacterium]|nr:hypothetical protein [Candidatus Moranbacteria bacterium]